MDESVIREMTRVAEDGDAINLAQGFPECPVPEPVLAAAHEALRRGAIATHAPGATPDCAASWRVFSTSVGSSSSTPKGSW